MFKLTHPLPATCIVAVSGGVDSMVALHWLSKVPGRVKGVAHFNHNTGDFSTAAANFVAGEAKKLNLPFFDAIIPRGVPTGESPEAYWREQRYAFLDKLARDTDLPIVLAHQMNDCLEEYLICTLKRGYMGTIKYRRGDCIRPFRLWRREDIVRYAREEDVQYVDDPMNADTKYLRSFIRHELVPRVLEVNPGIWNIVEKLMREQDIAQLYEGLEWPDDTE